MEARHSSLLVTLSLLAALCLCACDGVGGSGRSNNDRSRGEIHGIFRF